MGTALSAKFGMAVLIAVLFASHVDGEPGESTTPARVLPLALDSLYPPIAPLPIYLIKMYELEAPLSGIESDAAEGDLGGARADFDVFQQKYQELAAMVPEWKNLYPLEPVVELKAALDAGIPDRIVSAVGGLGPVCGGCHTPYMAAAYHRYHWGDFGRVTVTEPSSGKDMSFSDIMFLVDSDMRGIGIDLQQGQIKEARRHAKNLRTSFETLKKTCDACHDTERRYYVDSTMFRLIDGIETAIAATPPHAQGTREMVQKLDEESCFKCHLVHMAAANAQR